MLIQVYNKERYKEENVVVIRRLVHLNKWKIEKVRDRDRGDCEDKKGRELKISLRVVAREKIPSSSFLWVQVSYPIVPNH